MATLEKRVQVLFSVEQYARLEAEAMSEGMSVGAYIRRAVAFRLDRTQADTEEAWDRIFEHADGLPRSGTVDWAEEKAQFDRDILREGDPMRRAS